MRTAAFWLSLSLLFAISWEDHARIRRLVSAAFTPRAVRRMDAQVRESLQQTHEALSALASGLPELVEQEGLTPADAYISMIDVVREDAHRAGAAGRILRDYFGETALP